MHHEYCYFFYGISNIPDFVNRYSEKYPNDRVLVKLCPVSDFGDWADITRRFWDYLMSGAKKHLPLWTVSVVYGSEDSIFKKNDYKKSRLFALDTMTVLGQEDIPSSIGGCPICGTGKKLKDYPPNINERTVIAWECGFTETGRFLVHVSKYEELLKLELSGFKAKTVKCHYPDKYVISLWCGNIEKNRELLKAFSGPLPNELNIEEWGEKTLFFVLPDLINSKSFDSFDSYLADLDEKEELNYTLIPPAEKVGKLPSCRWVELEIIGKGVKELSWNEYLETSICPHCGKGGYCPKGPLKVNISDWDGSDFCLTDAGRICLSKRAYKIICEELHLGAEPVYETQ